MLIQVAIRNLNHKKMRTILTIIGLSIAVVGITGFDIASHSIIESAKISSGLVRSPDVFIYTRDTEWNQSFLDNQDNIKYYDVVYTLESSTKIGSKQELVSLNGMNISGIENSNNLLGLVLQSGNIPEKSNEILIEQSVAKVFRLNIGDSLKIYLPGDDGKQREISFNISGIAVGVYNLGYTFSSRVNIWMSIDVLHTIMNNNKFNQLYIEYKDNTDIKKATKSITDNLIKNNVFINDVHYYDKNEMDPREEVLNVLGVMMFIISGIGILIGGVLSASTIQMVIASERKNISLMKIIGGSKRYIFTLYVMEVILLGIGGSIIGIMLSILLGYGLIQILSNPFNLPVIHFLIPASSIVNGLLIPILTSLFFSIPIIISVLGIKPIEFLRKGLYTVNKKSHNSHSINIIRVSWTNLLRKRKRLIFNIIMLTLAIGLIVGIQSMSDTFTGNIDNFINSFPADIIVSSSSPENQSVMNNIISDFFDNNYKDELLSFTSLWWTQANIHLNDAIKVSLLGVTNDSSSVFKYKIIEGRWINGLDAGENNIVITKKFNNEYLNSSLHIGSEITLGTFMENRTFQVVGIVDDINNGGRMFYTNLLTLQEFFKGPDFVNIAYIRLKNSTMGAEISEALSKYSDIEARGWSITSMQYWREYNLKQAQYFTVFITVLSSLGLLISIIGGTNTFTMSAMEREQEIGILKLIGAKSKWILVSFLLEGLLQGFISSIFGILFARFVIVPLFLSVVAKTIVKLDLVFTIHHIILGFVITIITAFLGALYPAISASKTDALTALQYE